MNTATTNLEFVYQPAEDETVDAAYSLRADGQDTGISIQVTQDREYVVNHSYEEIPGKIETFVSEEIAICGALKNAKIAALRYYETLAK